MADMKTLTLNGVTYNIQDPDALSGTDITLTQPNKAADAAAVGAALSKKAPALESTAYPGCFYRTVGNETEWLNPPALEGVEYRTTERHMGKPVYRKLVTYETAASIGTASVNVPHGINAFGELVCISGNASGRPFPVIFSANEITTIYNVSNKYIRIIGQGSDMGACTMCFDIAYTKA